MRTAKHCSARRTGWCNLAGKKSQHRRNSGRLRTQTRNSNRRRLRSQNTRREVPSIDVDSSDSDSDYPDLPRFKSNSGPREALVDDLVNDIVHRIGIPISLFD